MEMLSCSFDLLRWHAAAGVLPDDAHWQAWAEDRLDVRTLCEEKPAVSFLPAMQRRRMGMLARLMFTAAWPLLPEEAHCPLVLVSHDGEINRGFDLWLNLYAAGDVSPTSFGLSVHNALAGQWSMQRGDMSEHTALCVREAALETGLVEACGILQDGAAQVLLVIADEPLAAQYAVQHAERPPFAHALALLIGQGQSWRIRREIDAQSRRDGAWSALSFIRAQYRQTPHWQQAYDGCRWHWARA